MILLKPVFIIAIAVVCLVIAVLCILAILGAYEQQQYEKTIQQYDERRAIADAEYEADLYNADKCEYGVELQISYSLSNEREPVVCATRPSTILFDLPEGGVEEFIASGGIELRALLQKCERQDNLYNNPNTSDCRYVDTIRMQCDDYGDSWAEHEISQQCLRDKFADSKYNTQR